METITDSDLTARIATKAPAWAQDVIYRLDRQLAEARKRIAELSEGPADSNVRTSDYSDHPDRLLGRNTRIAFDLDGGGTVVVHHGEKAENTLEVYCTSMSMSNHYPHITPASANTFRIRLGEY
jgi:hypothetical protein